jgi:uncharacterized protein (DUF1778 family)
MQDFLLNKMKLGRPELSEGERKGKIAGVRLRPDERDLVERAASIRRQSLSDWMRGVLLSTAQRQVRVSEVK